LSWLPLVRAYQTEEEEFAKFSEKSDELVKQILFVITEFKIKKVILCGYSMGGRAALNFASAYPEKISALILESTSAGIEIETERKAREIADKKLADFIYSYSIEEFVNSWLDSELFSSLKQLPEEKLKKLKTSKLHNSKIGLINSLIGFGTGVMPFIGNQITKMNFPVLLITGRHDSKFTQINTDLVNQFLNAEHKIIEGAGHNTHLEVPIKYNTVINQFLKKI
jgi:2-succinyl-6-hydroxy-2,4-cyclohexadiene-1-carboxylate synthase